MPIKYLKRYFNDHDSAMWTILEGARGGVCAQPHARSCRFVGHQFIMFREVLYDYLIGIVAEKLADLAQTQGRVKRWKIEELEINEDTYS